MEDDSDWLKVEDEGFFEGIGPVLHQPLHGSSALFRFRAESKHRNRRNVVHGGMLLAFADLALGTTSRLTAPSRPQATVQLNVQFIRAAKIGDLVEMDCHIVRETRTLIFIEGTMTSLGEVIAKASGLWNIGPAKPPNDAPASS